MTAEKMHYIEIYLLGVAKLLERPNKTSIYRWTTILI